METGEIYLRARYYVPTIGRFTTVDPAMDGTNWYVYCGNNPVMYVDPWGLYDKALLESLRGYIFGYDNRHTDYHNKANAVRDELKVNAQYLEGWNEGSELDELIAKITCDDAYIEGSSISDVNRAIELTDEYWKDYNRKNTIENIAFTAGIVTVILPATKAAVGSVAVSASGGLNFADKAAKHMLEPARFVPIQILQEAIRSGTPSPDPQGSNATMYTIEMIKGTKEYILEVLYEETTNTIYHFMYYNK